jgi:anti-sigma-K factor RskA
VTDKNNDPTSLTGAYALNALSAEERAAVEAGLGESESLRHEVTELADTAVLLGRAVAPVTPPPALKASIMDMIASTPQLPPLQNETTGETDATASVTEIAPPRPASPSAASPAPTPAERKAQARWFTKPAIALASVAAVLGLIVGGGVLVNTMGESQQNNQAADQLAAINAASDSQRAVSEIEGGGTATLVWSGELASAAMIVDGLPALPDDKVYELWFIGEETGARPAGTFTVSDDGRTLRVLDGEMHAGDAVGVTVEPRGGSETPTTEPIVAITSA